MNTRMAVIVMLICVVCCQQQKGSETKLKPGAKQPVGFFTEIIYNFVFLSGVGLAVCELIIYCLQDEQRQTKPEIYGRFNEEVVVDNPQVLSESPNFGSSNDYLREIQLDPKVSIEPLGSASEHESPDSKHVY